MGLTSQEVAELVPAFVSAGLVLVVVGVGVVMMIWLRYPAPRADGRPRVVAADRVQVKQGLRFSGLVVIGLGAAGLVVTREWLAGFGPGALAVSAGLVAVGVILLGAGAVFSVMGEVDQ